jgi:hypothetical protein
MSIKCARWLFLLSGLYGVLVITPMLFLERLQNELSPPPLNHPEWYYGFVWVTLGWQIVYLLMSRDPLRFRPMILPAILGKAGFAGSALVLVALQRLDALMIGPAFIDLTLACLFLWAFIGLRDPTRTQPTTDHGPLPCVSS